MHDHVYLRAYKLSPKIYLVCEFPNQLKIEMVAGDNISKVNPCKTIYRWYKRHVQGSGAKLKCSKWCGPYWALSAWPQDTGFNQRKVMNAFWG